MDATLRQCFLQNQERAPEQIDLRFQLGGGRAFPLSGYLGRTLEK